MDAYWRYSSGGQQAAVLPALTPLVAKRPRNKYGYKFDHHEYDSVHLMLQFARNPCVRSGGGNRGIC
uniref:Nucleic acid binding protein n=1 Tax=Solanum tuberosum TaxID=4113 RepID=M0ZL66_SOLTU